MDLETHDAIAAVRTDIDALRAETRAGFRAVDERFGAMEQRFVGIDERFDAVEQRIDEFRRDVLRQFGILAEDLRDQIRIIAEGVVMNAEAIVRVRAELDDLRRR